MSVCVEISFQKAFLWFFFSEGLLLKGIHGTKVGCGSFINDHILYQVLKKLFDKYSDFGKFEQIYFIKAVV